MFEMKRNIEKLNNRLGELSSLLIAAEEKDKTNKVKIENLGKKLNQALAGKLQEISKYQSEFFKKLKKLLEIEKTLSFLAIGLYFPQRYFLNLALILFKKLVEKNSTILL